MFNANTLQERFIIYTKDVERQLELYKQKRQAQMEYCNKKRIPYWAGDGICLSCHKNVFDEYSLEYCQTDIISGCPYCHFSFVD